MLLVCSNCIYLLLNEKESINFESSSTTIFYGINYWNLQNQEEKTFSLTFAHNLKIKVFLED